MSVSSHVQCNRENATTDSSSPVLVNEKSSTPCLMFKSSNTTYDSKFLQSGHERRI
uniref:Uncharacterized protein n=1 Tax=Arion vulgaris TaxID=1028688 RepID=A0A0B6Z5N7_9EUPU